MKKLLTGIFRPSAQPPQQHTPRKADAPSAATVTSSSSGNNNGRRAQSPNEASPPVGHRTGPRSSWGAFFSPAPAAPRTPSTPPLAAIRTPEKVSLSRSVRILRGRARADTARAGLQPEPGHFAARSSCDRQSRVRECDLRPRLVGSDSWVTSGLGTAAASPRCSRAQTFGTTSATWEGSSRSRRTNCSRTVRVRSPSPCFSAPFELSSYHRIGVCDRPGRRPSASRAQGLL